MGADAEAEAAVEEAGASGRAVAWIFLGLGFCIAGDGREASVSVGAGGVASGANSGKPFSRKW
jgi:hypothetical protein